MSSTTMRGPRRLATTGLMVASGALALALSGAGSPASGEPGPSPTGTGLPGTMVCTDPAGSPFSPKGGSVLLALSHSVVSPRDQASGQASGKRQHKPLTITKEYDRSTPLLRQALTENQTFKSCVFRLYRLDIDKQPVNYLTVSITSAKVVQADTRKDDVRGTENDGEAETIAFTYSTIRWTWTFSEEKTTFEDSWMAPTS